MNPNLTANLRAERELYSDILADQLAQISGDLERAEKALQSAKRSADGIKLEESRSAAYTALCDALTNTQEANKRLKDAPDQ